MLEKRHPWPAVSLLSMHGPAKRRGNGGNYREITQGVGNESNIRNHGGLTGPLGWFLCTATSAPYYNASMVILKYIIVVYGQSVTDEHKDQVYTVYE